MNTETLDIREGMPLFSPSEAQTLVARRMAFLDGYIRSYHADRPMTLYEAREEVWDEAVMLARDAVPFFVPVIVALSRDRAAYIDNTNVKGWARIVVRSALKITGWKALSENARPGGMTVHEMSTGIPLADLDAINELVARHPSGYRPMTEDEECATGLFESSTAYAALEATQSLADVTHIDRRSVAESESVS